MPIYDYICNKCEKTEERFQKSGDTAIPKCSQCNESMEKLMSASGFDLVGKGFYKQGRSAK